jgi:hypothetical protein
VTATVTVTGIRRVDTDLRKSRLFYCDSFSSRRHRCFVAHESSFMRRQRSTQARGGEQPLLRAGQQGHVDGRAVAPEVAPPAYHALSLEDLWRSYR